jgi:hypothetical protein
MEIDLGVMVSAFEKNAASKERMAVPKLRSGRRPMSVDTMLKREKDGTLFKKTAKLILHFAVDELQKLGQVPSDNAISRQEAWKALKEYKELSKDRPDVGEMGRYALVGAAATPAIGAVQDVVSGTQGMGVGAGKQLSLGKRFQRTLTGGTRKILGRGVAGAATMGLLPVVKHYVDRRAMQNKLQQYMAQQQPQQQVAGA